MQYKLVCVQGRPVVALWARWQIPVTPDYHRTVPESLPVPVGNRTGTQWLVTILQIYFVGVTFVRLFSVGNGALNWHKEINPNISILPRIGTGRDGQGWVFMNTEESKFPLRWNQLLVDQQTCHIALYRTGHLSYSSQRCRHQAQRCAFTVQPVWAKI